LVVFLLCPPIQTQAQSEAAKLESFFRHYLEEQFEMRPLVATQLGDHRFDHRLESLRPESRTRWVDHTRRTLAELPKAVDRDALPRAAQVDYEILEHELRRDLWLAENTHPFEEDPRTYNAYINDSVYLLLAQSSLPKEANISNAIARMALIPEVIAAARTNLKTPPRVHTETALRQNLGAIAFYERDLFEFAGKTRQKAALERAAVPVVAALTNYQAWLEHELLPRANGEWRLGKQKFAEKFERVIDAGFSADEALADAEAEFQRVRTEMYVIARQAWHHHFPHQPLPADDAAGRRDTVEQVLRAIAQDHGTPKSLTRDTKRTVAAIKQFIEANHILELPGPDRCEIIEMPEFQRGNSTAYMNSPPPLDTTATGYYAVSPPPRDWDADRVRSFFEEYNGALLQILTIHEAYPGHYVQMEYANRNPSLIRKVLGSGVYIEGWAVYTEQMMLDQGYGEGDLGLRLNQLKFYLRAVVNTILDYQMHCQAMTDKEAMDLMVNQAFQSEGEARLKVIRAKQSSVQLSTYFAGRMAHYRLRQQIQRELGDRFELAAYHHAVLNEGSVPVKYLPELVGKRLGTHP
jgi:uncharacterized protein (DUF885 family)